MVANRCRLLLVACPLLFAVSSSFGLFVVCECRCVWFVTCFYLLFVAVCCFGVACWLLFVVSCSLFG